MKSLFNKADNDAIINRINQINNNSKPLWGKMNAAQMLAHCQVPLKVGFGEVKLKRNLIGILFGGLAKRTMVNEKPFKKNLPTDRTFVITEHPVLETEKQNLAGLVQRFTTFGPAGLSNEPHPFFGKLTNDEWDILSWKHLDHHLRQFGV